jgi:hypothetical protein
MITVLLEEGLVEVVQPEGPVGGMAQKHASWTRAYQEVAV